MSIMKIIKDRGSDQGHEADLRGLGSDPVLTEADPISVLSVSGASPTLAKIEKLAVSFDPALNILWDGNLLHVSFDKKKNITHKVQAIQLFGLFHHLHSQLNSRDDVVFSFWQADRLKFHLSKKQSENFDLLKEVQLTWDSHLTVQYPVNLYLAQAGFEIERTSMGVSMDHSATTAMIKHNVDLATRGSDVTIKHAKGA